VGSGPRESWRDSDKIELPDFRYKDLASVKQCLQAAGWKWKIGHEDDNTWGEDTVLKQFPEQGADVDPDDVGTIELSVSTGNPPQ
jgi:beta-lactam-binding protein with PASTA domain